MSRETGVQFKAAAQQPSAAYTEDALQYIALNYAKPITVNEICAYLALCRGHFTRIFQSEVKMSPKQYIIKYRIEQAQALIKNTDLTIAEIGSRCGFKSGSNFAATFKRVSGRTPQQYRLSQRQDA